MNKRKRLIIALAALLIITGSNYYRISSTDHIRLVDFLSIFAIGALAGILINQLAQSVKESRQLKQSIKGR